jgi:hypothetical protein
VARGFVIFSSLLIVGCNAAPSAPAAVSLAQADQVSAAGIEQATFQVTAQRDSAQELKPTTFDIHGLTLALQTGDRPELTTLELDLGEMDVPARVLPPNGLKLRDVKLEVDTATAAVVVHAQDDALELRIHTPLTLRWQMVLADGSTWALGPSRTEPIDVDVAVVRDAAGYTATLNASCTGECWSLDGIGSLRDASISVEATADVHPLR